MGQIRLTNATGTASIVVHDPRTPAFGLPDSHLAWLSMMDSARTRISSGEFRIGWDQCREIRTRKGEFLVCGKIAQVENAPPLPWITPLVLVLLLFS